jgi:AraC-like DNA-binding protein
MNAPMLLSRHTIFRTRNPREAEDSLCRNLCPHRLITERREVNAVHNRATLTQSELSFISYGVRVQVKAPRLEDSYLLLVGSSGNIRVQMKHADICLAENQAAIIPPDTPFTIEGDSDASALVWKLKQHAVEKQAALLLGSEPVTVIRFLPTLSIASGTGASFVRTLYFVADELDSQESVLLKPHTLSLMEQSLTMALLQAYPNDLPGLDHGRNIRLAPACVRRVEDYIAAHAAEDIAITDLIEAAGVPGRTLFRTFRHFRHMSPMAYLRAVRMDRIRADLLSPPADMTVTEIMSRWGVSQFGRFSAAYRKKYGELPSETLRRSSGR